MHHVREAFGRKQCVQRRMVGHIGLHKPKTRQRQQLRQPRLLERRVVVVVQVVQAQHFIAARNEQLGHMHADKAGGTGEEDSHDRKECLEVATYRTGYALSATR